jgi:cytochrome P450 family 6
MGFGTFIALIGLVAGLITYWFKKKFSYFEERGFEFVKPDFPFGCLKGVGYKIHFSQKTKAYYREFHNKAKAIGLYFFTAPTVLIVDLDTIKHVLVKDFNNFHDRGLYVNKESDPLSAHLFAIEGEITSL